MQTVAFPVHIKCFAYSLLLLLAMLCSVPQANSQQVLGIGQVQGQGGQSPFLDEVITLDQVVVVGNFEGNVYLTDDISSKDGVLETSDGLWLFLPGADSLVAGDRLRIQGTVVERTGMTTMDAEGLLISRLGMTDLPTPTAFPGNLEITNPTPNLLEPYEGMYVTIDGLVNEASFGNEALINPLGIRAFREPGNFLGTGGPEAYDGNPELLIIQDRGWASNRLPELPGGSKISTRGFIMQGGVDYYFIPTELSTTEPEVTKLNRPSPRQISIASLNGLFMGSGSNDFFRRKEMAQYIVRQMGAPSIIGFQEILNLSALRLLAEDIAALDSSLVYQAYWLASPGDLSNGFLVRDFIEVEGLRQLGDNQQLSIGGRVHDRPPLVLEAMALVGQDTLRFQVMNLHMRSLIGIEGQNSNFVRTKRHEAAISVARIIQVLRNDNLIILGDLNAFEFSDGYVDVVNQLSGLPSLGAERSPIDIVTPPLDLLTLHLSEDQRYTFVFDGSAQMLDHMLINELENMSFDSIRVVPGNSDYLLESDGIEPYTCSDHDGQVAYFSLEGTLSNWDEPVAPVDLSYSLNIRNPWDSKIVADLTLEQFTEVHYELYDVSGRKLADRDWGFFDPGEQVIEIPLSPVAGFYILRIFVGDDISSHLLVRTKQ